jgi:hypothetical protein
MKAYDMLNERMHKFSKLPPAMGRRVTPAPENFGPVPKSSSEPGES